MTSRYVGKYNFTYGAGYTHSFGKILTLTGTVSHKSKQGVGLGAGFAAKFGFVQLYSAVDNFIGISDVRNM